MSSACDLAEGDRAMFVDLQRQTFEYFLHEYDPGTGLIADKSEPGSPASIAAVGLGLSAYTVAVERGLMSRELAIERTLAAMRFFRGSHQGPEADASGYRGFYYHFLDMQTGRRAWQCELSTIDTALLVAGFLCAGLYFGGDAAKEKEIRDLAELLYRRVDWLWAMTAAGTLSHGWKPEAGFLDASWSTGYSEALILYVLALGSPTSPIPAEGYRTWTTTFERVSVYGIEYVYAGPLFIHQLSHAWIDFRGICDDRNREDGFDYFENSRRATEVHQRYAIENPRGFAHYSRNNWGLAASDGPGPAVIEVGGVRREFDGYLARGAPWGPDDGTVSPWAVVAALPFAPKAVSDTVRHAIARLSQVKKEGQGFDASFNPTFPSTTGEPNGWVSPWKFGLNEGPIILMIENHLSGEVWSRFRAGPYVASGLGRAGFKGGWLIGRRS